MVIYTILETAKANGLNPEAHLNDILTVLPDRFVHRPDATIADLLPWMLEIRQRFMS